MFRLLKRHYHLYTKLSFWYLQIFSLAIQHIFLRIYTRVRHVQNNVSFFASKHLSIFYSLQDQH